VLSSFLLLDPYQCLSLDPIIDEGGDCAKFCTNKDKGNYRTRLGFPFLGGITAKKAENPTKTVNAKKTRMKQSRTQRF
jgi:hypothetical protein